jgi:hypothetical protein
MLLIKDITKGRQILVKADDRDSLMVSFQAFLPSVAILGKKKSYAIKFLEKNTDCLLLQKNQKRNF